MSVYDSQRQRQSIRNLRSSSIMLLQGDRRAGLISGPNHKAYDADVHVYTGRKNDTPRQYDLRGIGTGKNSKQDGKRIATAMSF